MKAALPNWVSRCGRCHKEHLTLQLDYGTIEGEAAGGRELGILVYWLEFDQDAE
jgi:hypothetical protein